MAELIDDIQSRYIAELRSVLPSLEAWWGELVEKLGDHAWKTWPTGYSGHPRVLAIFRKYYFEIEALNEERADAWQDKEEEIDPEELWGEDVDPDDLEFENHAEWLIFNIIDEAPDLETLVNGLCYVPIGMEPDEEPV
jgi:hypothetical protein